jgi:hypothetical protein
LCAYVQSYKLVDLIIAITYAGTGKSYFGVVLVRALVLIRDLWLRKTKNTVGTPPILVLSYKNHAIDEFLLDLVKNPSRSFSSGNLIRIGNSPEPSLRRYSESQHYTSDHNVRSQQYKVEEIDRLRGAIRTLLNGTIVSFMSFKTEIFQGSDERSRRKAANDATTILMENLVRKKLMDSVVEVDGDDSIIEAYGFLDNSNNSNSFHRLMNKSGADHDNMIANLSSEIQHYRQHWGDTIYMFLCGKRPLQKCVFNNCNSLAMSQEIKFCEAHICDSRDCQNPRVDEGNYCDMHTCKDHLCQSLRLDNQSYCSRHVCKQCHRLGYPSELAQDDPPRNVCEKHPLCSVPLCDDLCKTDSRYCRVHDDPKCQVATKKGKSCRGKVINRYTLICKDHFKGGFDVGERDVDESFKEKDEVDNKNFNLDEKRAQCQQKKCTLTVMSGSSYCYIHALPSSIEITEGFKDKDKPDENPARCAWENCSIIALNRSVYCYQHAQKSSEGLTSIMCTEIGSIERNVRDSEETTIVPIEFDTTSIDSLIETDSVDLEAEADNIQRLREVFEVADDLPVDAPFDDDLTNLEVDDESVVYSDPTKWTWDMSLEERFDAAHSLMEVVKRGLKTADDRLKVQSLQARQELKKYKILAKARMYEGMSVIGGTMVGCITRID